ncbi:MAG: hypothetical protein WAU73_17940 [Candidatus Sulfotelmatobacter sp.]
MGDFTNITLDGKPLAEVLRQQRLSEVQEHFATEEADLRRKLARGRNTPVPLAGRKRGRKPIEVSHWAMSEIRDLAADESLSVAEIANRSEQPARLVRLCLRQLQIKRKRGRKKRVPADQCGAIREADNGEAMISELSELRDADSAAGANGCGRN